MVFTDSHICDVKGIESDSHSASYRPVESKLKVWRLCQDNYISIRYFIRSIQLPRESNLAGLNEICSSQSTNEIRYLEHQPKSAPSCNIIIHIILLNSKVHCNLLNVMHGCTIMHRTSYLLLFLQLSDPTCT